MTWILSYNNTTIFNNYTHSKNNDTKLISVCLLKEMLKLKYQVKILFLGKYSLGKKKKNNVHGKKSYF